MFGFVLGCVLVACSTTTTIRVERSDRTPPITAGTTPAGGTTEPAETTPTDPTDSTSPIDTVPLVDTGDGIGDPLFPDLGNPGIDVLHYDVQVNAQPDAPTLDGTVIVTLRATRDLAEFTLDATTPAVATVSIDDAPVEFVHESPELRITPASPLAAGDEVDVTIVYTAPTSAQDSPAGLPLGWTNTPGGSFVLDEPDGMRNWLPSNDHPSDKASYRFDITVGFGLTAVANGSLTSHTTTDAGETWVWDQPEPMSTYLAIVIVGDYELVEGVGPNGLPLVSAVLRSDRATMQPFLDSIAAQIDFLDDLFGPFPLASYGIAITESFPGLAMETQGLSLFSRDDFLDGELGFLQELLLAHELTHQWFGDAVSPEQWDDIWLNESFATYGQWLWLDHVGLQTLQAQALSGLENRPLGATGDPTVDEMFGFNSYDGGAAVVHALRLTIGDDAFFTLLQRWIADNNGTSRSTADFIALTNEVTSSDQTAFFDEWLFATTVPSEFPEGR